VVAARIGGGGGGGGGGRRTAFLGALAKLQKGTVSFMSFYTSAWNNSDPTGRIFMKRDI